MKILVSNDDGIFAQGIRALANGLVQAGHDVTVVCPDRERSATGHGLTLHTPIRAEKVESVFDPRVSAWGCSGTPSDCVKLALFALLTDKPDLVISGINHGPNLGTDVIYSGTVSAAMEGLIENIPSIAISLAHYTSRDFQVAVNFANKIVGKIERSPLAEVMLLNVNIPGVKEEEIAGVTIARQGIRRYVDIFTKRVDPRGKVYYWLAGKLEKDVTVSEDSSDSNQMPTDVTAIYNNFITITPLQYNLTYVKSLDSLQAWQIANFS
jgi:5'-nucleotidase